MLEGLERGDQLPFYVEEVEGKGRGVFCSSHIPKGAYVCEYKTSRLYPATRLTRMEREYARNAEGSFPLVAYCMDAASHQKKKLVFDATRRTQQVMSQV